MGDNEEIKNMLVFTPDYNHIIKYHCTARDLGVFIDADCRYVSQRCTVIKKTNQKCGWILRALKISLINI